MTKRICSIDGCSKEHLARGWCKKHYMRWYTHGDPTEDHRRRSFVCMFDGCSLPHRAKGYCNAHYLRLIRGQELAGEVRSFDPDRGCSVDGCQRPHEGRGYCELHGNRSRNGLDLNSPAPIKDPVERFWSRVDKRGVGGCWHWTGTQSTGGYGRFSLEKEQWAAHRLAWTLTEGEIPEGKVIDHKCRNTLCVNPSHLQIVGQRENMQHLALRSSNTSGYRGAYWDKTLKKWRARASLDGRSYYLGVYLTADEAGQAAARWRRANMSNSLLDKDIQ